MNKNLTNSQNNMIIYITDDGQVRIDVRLEDENVWLTQNAMAELFDTTRNNITMHIKNIFVEGELDEKSVSKESLLTAKDGKNYNTKFYNLDVIISIGYRVYANSFNKSRKRLFKSIRRRYKKIKIKMCP